MNSSRATVLPSCKHATFSRSRLASCIGSNFCFSSALKSLRGGHGLPAPSLRTALYTAAQSITSLCSLQLSLCFFYIDPVTAVHCPEHMSGGLQHVCSHSCVNFCVAHHTLGFPSCAMQPSPTGEARTQPAAAQFSLASEDDFPEEPVDLDQSPRTSGSMDLFGLVPKGNARAAAFRIASSA